MKGTLKLSWDKEPPKQSFAGEEFPAAASASYAPNFDPEDERGWELVNPKYTFDWRFEPDGTGNVTQNGSKSDASITFPTPSAAQNDKKVRVSVRLVSQLIDFGEDNQKGTADDKLYDVDQQSDWLEAALTVLVKLTLSDTLWWFDGEKPSNYAVATTLTAEAVSKGKFVWEVTKGDGKVILNNGGQDGQTIEATDDNTVTVKSKGPSTKPDDVTVELTYNGAVAGECTLTVFTPASTTLNYCNDKRLGNGYETEYSLKVHDQFGSVLPKEVEINEKFGAWTSEWFDKQGRPETWPEPSESGGMTVNINIIDSIYCTGYDPIPQPVYPDDPAAGTKVQSTTQTWRAGSDKPGKACSVKSHVFRMYRGKGRYE